MAAPATGTHHQELVSASQPANHDGAEKTPSPTRQVFWHDTLPGFPWVETTGGCLVLQGGNRWYRRTSRQDRGPSSPVSACLLLRVGLMPLKTRFL